MILCDCWKFSGYSYQQKIDSNDEYHHVLLSILKLSRFKCSITIIRENSFKFQNFFFLEFCYGRTENLIKGSIEGFAKTKFTLILFVLRNHGLTLPLKVFSTSLFGDRKCCKIKFLYMDIKEFTSSIFRKKQKKNQQTTANSYSNMRNLTIWVYLPHWKK